jgi:hypothetical protein
MKKQLVVCDSCGAEVGPNGGVMRLNYSDMRRGAKTADLCGECADNLPGRSASRRGRRPKSEE